MTARFAAAVATAVLLLAGCASDPLPQQAAVTADLSDPGQVITHAMETMFSWDPTREDSPSAAYQRAAPYLTSGLAGQHGAAAPGPGSQWAQWRADGATLTAKAYFVADETPPNTDDQVHHVVVIVQSASTADHRLIDEIRQTAWVVAERSGGGWHVSSIQF